MTSFGNSVLLLDDFSYYMQVSFLSVIREMGTYVDLIYEGYTCVLQPSDVGVLRAIKLSLKNAYFKRVSEKLVGLSDQSRVSVPDRNNIF